MYFKIIVWVPIKSRALQAQMPEVLFECSLSNFLVCTSFSFRNIITVQAIV